MRLFTRRHAGALVALLVGVLVLVRFGPAIGLLLGFVVITPLELLFRRHQQPVRREGLATDALHFLFTGVLRNAATLVGVGVVYVLLRRLTFEPSQEWLASQHALVQFALALLIFEAFGYWYHRMSHEVPFLWRFHAVHHSSTQLDWVAASRLHPLEGFFQGLFIGPPLVVLGFGAVNIPAVATVLTLWAILLHANVSWRMRWLGGIVGTPEYHHWHHTLATDARNKNYAALLPVLDRMFGTYHLPSDRRPEGYGIDEPMPDGWLAQLVHPLRRRRRVPSPA